MNDLISREALLETLRHYPKFITATDALKAIENAPAITPQVVANISGGMLQGATANYKLDVYTLDFDYDGESPSCAIRDPDGDEAWFGQQAAEVDPDWVKKVINSPTLDEEPCGQCEGTGRTQSASNLEDEACPVCDGEG